MKILSIESSCDETSVAVVEKIQSEIKVLSNITATSLSMHAATGGIIPENAAREQVKYIMPVIIEALLSSNKDSKIKKQNPETWQTAREILRKDIDSIAITYGPGLIGSLLVGVETAKTLSFVFEKPLLPINHLLAHIYANYINRKEDKISFPFIGFIVSGGHTDLLLFKQHGQYQWLGGTRDDAAGEAFDKVGRLLNLSYPAGPEIEKRAQKVSNPSVKFKSPIIGEDNFDFSFSGLKTEVLRFVQKNPEMSETLKNEICFATQKAISDVLVKKTLKAAEKYDVKTILVGGGVSANQTLTEQFKLSILKAQLSISLFVPQKEYSTDNGAMVGAYALLNPEYKSWEEISANPELYFS